MPLAAGPGVKLPVYRPEPAGGKLIELHFLPGANARKERYSGELLDLRERRDIRREIIRVLISARTQSESHQWHVSAIRSHYRFDLGVLGLMEQKRPYEDVFVGHEYNDLKKGVGNRNTDFAVLPDGLNVRSSQKDGSADLPGPPEFVCKRSRIVLKRLPLSLVHAPVLGDAVGEIM